MKIKSFGCSFIYGSDLSDFSNNPEIDFSNSVWPALIADRLNIDYECYALPGQGNFKILCDIISQTSLTDPALMIINWSWMDRFDYIDQQELWQTLRPSENTTVEKFYYRNLHSQYQDVLKSAYYVNSAIDILNEKCYPFVMSYMDYNLLTPIDPTWHDPRPIEVIQRRINKYLTHFNGMNFLDWSRGHGFSISEAWHPLEEAHAAAADYMFDQVKEQFDKLSKIQYNAV
jgi:hypothetical protein